jgi:hypothetical protein
LQDGLAIIRKALCKALNFSPEHPDHPVAAEYVKRTMVYFGDNNPRLGHSERE